MAKRRNDGNQETKEEYEAREQREAMEGGGGGGNGGGFSRASSAAMRGRRIVRVSANSRYKKRDVGAGAGAANFTPSIAAPSTATSAPSFRMGGGTGVASPPTSNNPFARTVLTPASKGIANMNNNGGSDSKPNPFSNINLSSTTKPSTSGGGGFQFQPSTKRSRPSSQSTPSISFGNTTTTTAKTSTIGNSNSNRNSLASSSTSLSPLGTSSKENDNTQISEGSKRTLMLLRTAQMEYNANKLSDWSIWLKVYKNKVASIPADSEESKVVVPASASTSTSIVGTSSGNPGASTNGNLFSAAATTTTSNSSSSGLFTFGKTENATTKSTPSSAPAPASNTATTSEKKDLVEIDKVEKVDKIIDKDLEDLYECRAKYRKFVDNEWKSYSGGNLRLTKSKSRGTYQLVIRDSVVGKVLFNIMVYKGMVFSKPEKGKKGTGRIGFCAIQDEAEGLKQFILVTNNANIDGLHAILTKVSAK